MFRRLCNWLFGSKSSPAVTRRCPAFQNVECIKRLNLREGDVLFLLSSRRVSPAQVRDLREAWAKYVANVNVPVLLLEEGLDVKVINARPEPVIESCVCGARPLALAKVGDCFVGLVKDPDFVQVRCSFCKRRGPHGSGEDPEASAISRWNAMQRKLNAPPRMADVVWRGRMTVDEARVTDRTGRE